MLLFAAIVLVLLWALGFFLFHVTGWVIHLLLLVAAVVVVVRLVRRARPAS